MKLFLLLFLLGLVATLFYFVGRATGEEKYQCKLVPLTCATCYPVYRCNGVQYVKLEDL